MKALLLILAVSLPILKDPQCIAAPLQPAPLDIHESYTPLWGTK